MVGQKLLEEKVKMMNFALMTRDYVSNTRNVALNLMNVEGRQAVVRAARVYAGERHPAGAAAENPVSFLLKNPDFLLKNPDFLLKNPDSRLTNVDVIIKQLARRARPSACWWMTAGATLRPRRPRAGLQSCAAGRHGMDVTCVHQTNPHIPGHIPPQLVSHDEIAQESCIHVSL